VSPTGGGTIDPEAGEHTYDEGDVVSITAEPNEGYVFSSWSGDCSGNGSCSVTMDADKSVTANFNELPTYDLTILVNPYGGGTLNPAAGTHTYTLDEIVEITAEASPGYEFSGWGGECSGTGFCTVTMDEDKTVIANFTALPTFVLTTIIDPVGGGTVTPAEGEHTYYEGDFVEVTANPTDGYIFSGWDGDCLGSGACSLIMNQNKTVTAIFVEAPDVLGDVNGDDDLNSTDALIILSGDVGIDISQFCPINCGDVNGDGYVNSTDALIILSYDVGMTVPFPIGVSACPASVTPCPGCNP